MVTDPGEYRWSSYQINVEAKNSDLCTPHPEYLALGVGAPERQGNYRALFASALEGDILKEIQNNTKKGMVVGNDRFREAIESLTGRRVKPKKRGRPLGWRKTDKVDI